MGNIVDTLCDINIAVVKNLCAVQDCSITVLRRPPLNRHIKHKYCFLFHRIA